MPRTIVLLVAISGLTNAALRLPFARGDEPRIDARAVTLRFVGGDDRVPLAGAQVLVTEGYGSQQKRFGPYRLNDTGSATIHLPPGFYGLHLSSDKEWPYLPVERLWTKQARTTRPDLSLYMTETAVEKWLDGKAREEGFEPAAQPGGPPRVTYALLPGCELTLRAVDAETGEGLPGVTFYTENALAEDWGRPIVGENLGAKSPAARGAEPAKEELTDDTGRFRRRVGANAGYTYGVETIPAGYELVEPRAEVTIDIRYGTPRAEQVFRFRKKR